MPLDRKTTPDVSFALQSALSASGFVGTWETDLSTKTVQLFGSFAAHVGIDTETAALGIPLARFLDGVHREDRDRVAELVDEAHRTAGRFESQFRTIGLDGKTHWISARGQVETDPHGRGLRCLGVALDVTDTRQAEAISEEQFVRTVGQLVESLTTAKALVTSLDIPILKTLIDIMLFECGTALGKRMPKPETRVFH